MYEERRYREIIDLLIGKTLLEMHAAAEAAHPPPPITSPSPGWARCPSSRLCRSPVVARQVPARICRAQGVPAGEPVDARDAAAVQQHLPPGAAHARVTLPFATKNATHLHMFLLAVKRLGRTEGGNGVMQRTKSTEGLKNEKGVKGNV
jgi:hypothetical protein